jgi:hypothetical protein
VAKFWPHPYKQINTASVTRKFALTSRYSVRRAFSGRPWHTTTPFLAVLIREQLIVLTLSREAFSLQESARTKLIPKRENHRPFRRRDKSLEKFVAVQPGGGHYQAFSSVSRSSWIPRLSGRSPTPDDAAICRQQRQRKMLQSRASIFFGAFAIYRSPEQPS